MTRVAKALVYDEQGFALVLWRSDTHPHYAREADLPGGIVEAGESYVAGLVRELAEEVGIVVPHEAIGLMSKARHYVYGEKHLYKVLLGERPEVVISWEHERYEWVAPDDLDRVLHSKDPYMRFVRDVLRSES